MSRTGRGITGSSEPLKPTAREPLCDLKAQIAALLDPRHPKRAVWISGLQIADLTAAFPVPILYREYIVSGAGVLIASEHDCGRLEDDPSEETLADILDYVVPKSAVIHLPTEVLCVVQARDAKDNVVLEMLVDEYRLDAAARRCALFGKPVVMTVDDCLTRRLTLIAEEDLLWV